MQTLNYWKQFEHTGRVEDYLSYVSKEASVSGETFVPLKTFVPSEIPTDARIIGTVEKTGANPYAGIHMCDRNDIKTDAYRGI